MNFSTFSRIFHSHPLLVLSGKAKDLFSLGVRLHPEPFILQRGRSSLSGALNWTVLSSHFTSLLMLLNCFNVAQAESAKVALFCRQPQYSTHSLSSHQPPIRLHQNAHTQIHKYSSFLPQSFCCSFCRIISFRAWVDGLTNSNPNDLMSVNKFHNKIPADS